MQRLLFYSMLILVNIEVINDVMQFNLHIICLVLSFCFEDLKIFIFEKKLKKKNKRIEENRNHIV
jgi:hypothetical protein